MTYWTTAKYIHLSRRKLLWFHSQASWRTKKQVNKPWYKREINCYVIWQQLHIFHIISLFAVSLYFFIIIIII